MIRIIIRIRITIRITIRTIIIITITLKPAGCHPPDMRQGTRTGRRKVARAIPLASND